MDAYRSVTDRRTILMKDKCKRCLFFKPFDDEEPESNGQCRRFPPRTYVRYSNRGNPVWSRTSFAQTNPRKWCGEFKARDQE